MIETKTPPTPLMQQYNALKADYPHAILFFRLGDFYEMFDEDAKKASSVLGLVLTARQTTPMCGFPHHSASTNISKLLSAGHKVAICEQVASSNESESKKSKLFKREVVRLITPGTIIENDLLESKNSNYLLALSIDIVGWGLSYIDASTGEFYATQNVNDPNLYQLASLISRIGPVEIISDTKTKEKLLKRDIVPTKTILTQSKKTAHSESENYNWSKAAIWQNNRIALKATLSIIDYIQETQPGRKNTFEP
ncbi:MAG: DNA mismatch repair protein MutS, partial [Elusimicrobiota bacterium]|nr:DNA mismatch repair protein MutS [Elusimicrobiota bacterium]